MAKFSTIAIQNPYYCKKCKKKFRRNAWDLRPQLCDDCLNQETEKEKAKKEI